jgi:hypothetical protein
MPYPVGLLDPEADVTTSATTTFPLTVGTSYQPGDMRIVMVWLNLTTVTASSFPGFTKVVDTNSTVRYMVFKQVFTTATVSDSVCTLSGSVGEVVHVAFTVRNPNLSATLASTMTVSGTSLSGSSVVDTSTTVAANSVLVGFNCVFSMPSTLITSVAPPAGWTSVAFTQQSGASSNNISVQLIASNFASAGSSGTVTSAVLPTGSVYQYFTAPLLLIQNPDVTVSMTTSPNELDAGVVNTPSIPNTQTHFTMGIPNETDAAPQVFSQLTGFRISPLLAIPQSPITSSVVHWDQATPAVGSTVTVETSVDGGASWQPAVQDGPIARLLPGTSVWQTVQTRVTLKRLHVTDPSPSVSNVEVRVATNASNAELVSLGLFSINNTNITITGGTTGGSSGSGGGGNGVTGSGGGNTGGGLSIEISGVDLSRSVARNSWEDVYFVDSGTNYADAIHDIIEDRLPNTQYNFASTTHVTPKLIFGMSMDSDPWQDAQDLATAIGMELFFDALGVCTLRDVPDPGTGQSVWTFSDSANPTIASATRSLTDQTVFNYIVVYGESVDNAVPVSAVAFDDNPNSPTYYLGAYGKVPTSFTSPEITTVEQAQAAADALLNLSIGNAENVEISVVPNPAIEPGDVVTVTIGELKLTGTFMVNDMNTPLSAAEAQTFTVYRQTT